MAPSVLHAAKSDANSKAFVFELKTTLVQAPPAKSTTQDCPVAGFCGGLPLGLVKSRLDTVPRGTAPLKNVTLLKKSGDPHRKLIPTAPGLEGASVVML